MLSQILREVHVVLLDAGRTRALADEVGRSALRCIRCSACLNACPVYERVGGHAYGSVYPGPIGAILNPLLRGVGVDEQTDSLPFASSLCGRCEEVCPVAIPIPEILVDLRRQVVDAGWRGSGGGSDGAGGAGGGDGFPAGIVPGETAVRSAFGRPFRQGLSRRGHLLEGLAMRGAATTFGSARRLGLAERLTGLALGVARRLPVVTAWSGARDLPPAPRESFRTWWERTDGGRRESGGGGPR